VVPDLPHRLGGSLSSRVAAQGVMTDDALRVLLPTDPPELSSRAARILLEILLDARDGAGEASPHPATIPPEAAREEIER
jgi:hypothetical protein